MRIMSPGILAVSAVVVLPAAACSGNAAPGAGRSDCELAPADSVHLAGGPVYRDCQVDRRARLDARSSRIEMRPPTSPPPAGVPRCLEAEVELVVGVDGRPEQGTWRLVRSTDPSFGDAVLESVPGWHYEPALLDGRPVRQIVRERRAVAIVLAAGPTASPPPSPPRC